MQNELSKKEKDALDRQTERLEPKIVEAKHKYEDLVSEYAKLRVLFDNNGSFEEHEIRKLIEKAIRMARLHWRNYQIISKTDGTSKPSGKKIGICSRLRRSLFMLRLSVRHKTSGGMKRW